MGEDSRLNNADPTTMPHVSNGDIARHLRIGLDEKRVACLVRLVHNGLRDDPEFGYAYEAIPLLAPLSSRQMPSACCAGRSEIENSTESLAAPCA
jgi:hypothetical protein